MLAWSEYFQNPSYLEVTRKFLINEELRPAILNYCGVTNQSSVLDVGCGTGFFSRFLANGNPTISITGLEYEKKFVEYACDDAENKKLNISFIQGDALNLPFEDESFDAVTSHTFLTSVSDPQRALKEMIRVCKKGGTISSITAMSFIPSVIHGGYYRKECTWAKPLNELNNKMWNMYEKINPIKNYLNEITTAEIPHLFVQNGIQKISAFPIGKLFSLSNALLSYEDRIAYLEQMIESDRQKLAVYMEMEEARKLFSKEEAEQYLLLMEEKRDYYKLHPDENEIWEWNGGSNVLIAGKRGK